MMVRLKLSALKEGRWHEYVIRFALGGLTTVIADAIAKMWGPEAGGVFLAFPAILCASATLVEAHERREKHEHGVAGRERGTDAAGLETAGAGVGACGLTCFALTVWWLAPIYGPTSLLFGSLAWLLVALVGWRLRRNVRWHAKRTNPSSAHA